MKPGGFSFERVERSYSDKADGTFQLVHNGPNGESEDTALMIAHEQGVGKSTVKRAEKFAHGIDAIREQEPELEQINTQSSSLIKLNKLQNLCLLQKK